MDARAQHTATSARMARKRDMEEACALVKPALPKTPRWPNLRRVRDPTTIATHVVEHLIRKLEYEQLKKRYDEVLYPAYRKASKRCAARNEYWEHRQPQMKPRGYSKSLENIQIYLMYQKI